MKGPRTASASTSVVFEGLEGAADDVSAPAATAALLDARVPRTAVSGPIVLVKADGSESPALRRPLTIDTTARARHDGTGDSLGIDVEVLGNGLLCARAHGPVSYLLRGSQPANVAIELIRALRRRRDHALGARPRPSRDTAAGDVGRHRRRQGTTRRRYASASSRSPPPAATAASRACPCRDDAARPHAGSFISRQHLPIRGPAYLWPCAAPSAAARGTRARTRSPNAEPRWSATRAFVKFSATIARGNYLVIDATDEPTTTPTCTCATPRSSSMATTCYTGRHRLRRDTVRANAATCLRVWAARLVQRRHAVDRCRCCRRGQTS